MEQQIGQDYFGLTEPSRNEAVSVSTTSKVISEARNEDNERKVIVVRNTSDNVADIITLNLGSDAAVAENGIVLHKNETFTDSSESGYKAFQGVITAICATANGQLSIMER